jgi:protein SCO1/2
MLAMPAAWSAETGSRAGGVPPVTDFPQSTARVIKGGPFTLTTHAGETVTEQDFKGNYLLIFFGYTHCPDVCPADLAVMAQALELLGNEAGKLQPLFITFDPQRDDMERMADYVRNFDQRLIGLTGTKEQTLAAADHYGVDVSATYQAEQPGSAYSMNHSAFTYLVDQNGELRVMFRSGTSPELMAQTIRRHLLK